MKIKSGDKVRVISGNDKGKEGVVQKVYPKTNRVVVEGVNVRKKHMKPTQANPQGSILDIYAPINASNVALLDPKTKKPTKVGYKTEKTKQGKEVKVRYAKKTGNKID